MAKRKTKKKKQCRKSKPTIKKEKVIGITAKVEKFCSEYSADPSLDKKYFAKKYKVSVYTVSEWLRNKPIRKLVSKFIEQNMKAASCKLQSAAIKGMEELILELKHSDVRIRQKAAVELVAYAFAKKFQFESKHTEEKKITLSIEQKQTLYSDAKNILLDKGRKKEILEGLGSEN